MRSSFSLPSTMQRHVRFRRQAGIGPLLLLVIFAVLSAVAAYLMAPKPPSQDPPTTAKDRSTTAERGSYIPRVRGRRRIGHSILWLGNLLRHNYSVNRASAVEYAQEAWVGLCVGPAWQIRQIREGGKVIYTGSIRRDTHPSGTFVRTGQFTATANPNVSGPEGFYIYWGEQGQPVNTRLGGKIPSGISSRWPSLCYIEWAPKHLGQQTTWQQIDYDVECLVEGSTLSNTSPGMSGTLAFSGAADNVVTATDGAAGAATIKVAGDKTAKYLRLRKFLLAGNGASANGTYTVKTRSYAAGTNRTTITMVEAMTGSNNSGTIRPYADPTDDGPNPAHDIEEMLFAAWPQGAGMSSEDFDLDSLEDLGTLCVSDALPLSTYAADGASVADKMNELMADVGFVLSHDVRTGKIRFVPIRNETTIPEFPEEVVCKLPEISTVHQEPPATHTAFSFLDRSKKFRTGTYVIRDDGQSSLAGRVRQEKTEMSTVTDPATAAIVADRRSQEKQSEFGGYKLKMNREARYLWPGRVFSVEGIPETLRVSDVTIEPLLGEVEINAVTDYLAAQASTEDPAETGEEQEDDSGQTPSQDFESTPASPPGDWDGGPPPGASGAGVGPGGDGLWIPRLRFDGTTRGARIWVCETENGDYELAGESGYHCAGGTLADAMDADPGDITTGPDLDVLGPDIGNVRDLSSDPDAWAGGEQMLLVDDEIMFLEGVDESMGVYTLRGIKRAQLGTSVATHSSGAYARIIQWTEIEVFKHRFIKSGETVWVKVQPIAAEAMDLDDIEAVEYVVP